MVREENRKRLGSLFNKIKTVITMVFSPKKRSVGGHVFAIILGVLLLFGAIGSGRFFTPKYQLNVFAAFPYCPINPGGTVPICTMTNGACGTLGCCQITQYELDHQIDTCQKKYDVCIQTRKWCDSSWSEYSKTCCDVGLVCRSDMTGCWPPDGPPPEVPGLDLYELNTNLTDIVLPRGDTAYLRAEPVAPAGSGVCKVYWYAIPEGSVTGTFFDNIASDFFITDAIANNAGTVTSIYAKSFKENTTNGNCDVELATSNTVTVTIPGLQIDVASSILQSQTTIATAGYFGETPNHVTFAVSPSNIVSLSNTKDNTPNNGFTTKLTGSSGGTVTLTASSYRSNNNTVLLATDTASVTVIPRSASISLTGGSVTVGSQLTLKATVSNIVGGTVNRVTFTSSKSSKVKVITPPDTSKPYTATVRGVAPGQATITATVYFNNIATAINSATSTVTVTVPSWWQVRNSDIQTKGDLRSSVPAGSYFNIPPTGWAGGFPGVVAYPLGYTTNIPLAKVAATPKNWLANSSATNSKVFNYAYFAGQKPADVSPILFNTRNPTAAFLTANRAAPYGYIWLQYNGTATLTLPALDFTGASATRKVIVLVPNAAVNIGGKINLTDGSGFFMVIAKGNIIVANTVGGTGTTPHMEGLYITDGAFNTYSAANATLPLRIRGSVVGNTGVNMANRTYNTIATTPAIQFEYAPDQIWLFPGKLGARKINWNEVAP